MKVRIGSADIREAHLAIVLTFTKAERCSLTTDISYAFDKRVAGISNKLSDRLHVAIKRTLEKFFADVAIGKVKIEEKK